MNEESLWYTDYAVARDLFGRLMIERVRDPAIGVSEQLVNGQLKGITGRKFALLLSDFSDAQRDVLLSLAHEIVDETLHNLLWFLEQEVPIDIAVTTERGVVPSLRDVSDGLAGEMYGNKGWIRRFSKYPLEE